MTTLQRVAVSGATGFLGQHLTDRLLKDGYQVNILARDARKTNKFKGRVASTVIGDITDRDAVEALVSGADTVFHLVSNFRVASDPPEKYHAINVDGTRIMLDAAERAGVSRFLYCSTIGVHGDVRATPSDEDCPFNPGDLYQQTKLIAERLVVERSGDSTLETVVLRPCSIYGPGDMRMLKMFRMLSKKRFLMLGPCRSNFHPVFVDDVVDGFIRAMNTPGIGGQAFIIGGPSFVPLHDYIAAAAEAVDVPRPWIRLPYWPFLAAAGACEAICIPLGIEPPLHRRRVRFYRNNRAFSIQKARQALGYEPRVSLREGLARTVAWYRQNAYLD